MWSFEEEESFLLFWYCATEADSLMESAAAVAMGAECASLEGVENRTSGLCTS